MKRTFVSVCVIIVVLFTANVALSQSGTDYKAKIEAMNREMAKNMVAGNTEKLLSLYTDDAISMPSYAPIREGIAAIRKASEEDARSGSKVNSFDATTLKVMTSGNQITEIGTYKINMSMPKMDKPMEDHGKYVDIWEKQKDGSLKIKLEIWNSDVDPMAMMNQMGQKGADKK